MRQEGNVPDLLRPVEEIVLGTGEQACAIATSHGAYRLRTIRELLKRQGDKQEKFEFLDEHPIIRSLSDYGELVRTAFDKE